MWTLLLAAAGMGMACAETNPAPGVVRVACVGDSITFGDGLWLPGRSSYPARLQSLLGDGYEVRNFGVNGATLLKKGDRPYWETEEFLAASAFQPNVVVIQLGTNDAMRFPREVASDYETDYLALVDHFAALPSKPSILICKPVPIFFAPADRVMEEQVGPAVERVAQARGVKLVDLFGPMRGDQAMFPDAVHPDERGAAKIAELVHAALPR